MTPLHWVGFKIHFEMDAVLMILSQLVNVSLTQGKTHKLKPGAKEPVGGVAKGAPAQPLEDVSMRIYLCEGLLGALSLFLLLLISLFPMFCLCLLLFSCSHSCTHFSHNSTASLTSFCSAPGVHICPKSLVKMSSEIFNPAQTWLLSKTEIVCIVYVICKVGNEDKGNALSL